MTEGALKAPSSSPDSSKSSYIAPHRWSPDDFTAAHQIAALHDPDGHHKIGHFIVARCVPGADRPWQESARSVAATAFAAAEIAPGASDVYVSQQCFSGRWRRLSSLKHIGAAYIDLDYRKRVRWQNSQPEAVLWAAMRVLDDQNVPAPTYVVSTGNGLCAVWLHSWLPAQALPRWNAVQSRLAELLVDFGADKNALDAARVFRVIGSKNSRAKDWRNEIVRAVYLRGDPSRLREEAAYEFDDLAHEVLPLPRADLHSLQAERAKRRAEQDASKPPSPATRLNRSTYGESILADLHRLRYLRHGDGRLPPGQRDQWLFCASAALAHVYPPAVLEREIIALAAEVAGWSAREARSAMGAVVRRARAAAKQETILGPNGQPSDPRYHLSAAAIIERLEITPAEMRAGLRVLVDRDRKRALNTARTRRSRHERGATPRSQVRADRLALGRRALARQAQGGTVAEIAMAEGVSTYQVSKAMGEIRKKT